MPLGGLPERSSPGSLGGLGVLELPAALASMATGVAAVSLLSADADAAFLGDWRAAFDDAGVELECFLVDDGDLTDPDAGDEQERGSPAGWTPAEQLGATAGPGSSPASEPPTPADTPTRAQPAGRLADRHTDVRLVTGELARPAAGRGVGERDCWTATEAGSVSWSTWAAGAGPTPIAELAAVAGRARPARPSAARDSARAPLELTDYRCLAAGAGRRRLRGPARPGLRRPATRTSGATWRSSTWSGVIGYASRGALRAVAPEPDPGR